MAASLMLCMRGLRRTGWRFLASSRIAARPRPAVPARVTAEVTATPPAVRPTRRAVAATDGGSQPGASYMPSSDKDAVCRSVLIRMRSVGQGQQKQLVADNRRGCRGKTGGSTPADLSQLSYRLSGRRRTEEDSLDIRRILTCGYGFWRTGWTDGIDLRIRWWLLCCLG